MRKLIQFVGSLLLLIFALNTGAKSMQIQTEPKPAINVMPYPQNLQEGAGKLRITADFAISLSGVARDETIEAAANRLLNRLNARTLACFNQERVVLNEQPANPTLTIQVRKMGEPLPGIDESYQLSIDTAGASLVADNDIGALHGMETLLQLVNADSGGYYLPELKIIDAPRFRWRGMMVDVARHFIPLDVLKRNIDAMAMVKMNVLHLHLSDDEGFRVEFRAFPRLQEYGSKGQYYTQEQLKDLVNYAGARGIMVYPEFDLPGHSTSWFAGYPELASAPGPYKPGPRYNIKPGASMAETINTIMQSATPTLDPTKEEVYRFLDSFINEMTSVFPSPYLHIGADENNGAAWKNNLQIVQFMNKKGMKDVQELQAYFVNRMHAILKKHNRTMVGWEELYNANLPKDVIVQVWGAMGSRRAAPLEIAEKGNPVLISKGFYLDYFYPAYIHYLNPDIPSESNPYLLGGEAALWSELVDANTFEGRAWPRAAAVAERLWSPENIKDPDDMYRRLFVLSDRLEEAGLNHRLNSERMLSELCNGQDIQNPLKVLQTLGPSKGYKRLMAKMIAPERTRYQSVPLVDLPDLLSIDSKEAWQFRKNVESYLATRDTIKRREIAKQLAEWKTAALQIPGMALKAPNMRILESYASRVAQAADIGLQMLEKSPGEKEKADVLQVLKGMARAGDIIEIQILPEIGALVTGTLKPLQMSFSPF